MAQATLKNQQKLIADIRTVLANQARILRNQEQLPTLLANQARILRNQQTIVKNQRKILADHARHYRALSRRK